MYCDKYGITPYRPYCHLSNCYLAVLSCLQHQYLSHRSLVIYRASRRGNLVYCGKCGGTTPVVVLPPQHIQICCTGLPVLTTSYVLILILFLLFDLRRPQGLSHAREAGPACASAFISCHLKYHVGVSPK